LPDAGDCDGDLIAAGKAILAAEDPDCPVHRERTTTEPSARKRQRMPDDVAKGTEEPVGRGVAYVCKCRVLLTGAGADEQLAGYSRHRGVWQRQGNQGLAQELEKEMGRIATRNLGRDDRCISDWGREARFPFLDELVVRFLAGLPLELIADLSQPPGIGDKAILRRAARQAGLSRSSSLVKRAIQFGSQIAKLSNVASFGAVSKGRGDVEFRRQAQA